MDDDKRRFRFDFPALHAVLDQSRRSRQLTWKQVAAEIGVAASTLQRTSVGNAMEADGVRAMVAWLGRSPEDFIRAAPGVRIPPAKRREPPLPGRFRRVDSAALFDMLDRERCSRGMTWRQVAADLGGHVSPSALARLRRGGRVDMRLLVDATGWLGVSVEDVTHDTRC